AIYFPYTAPSSVPAEVAIEYGLTGGYVILVGGASAGVDALWQASTLLAAGDADLALVLAVETFEECADLWTRGRWVTPRPLVEAAACAVLAGADDADIGYGPGAASTLETLVTRRAGETLACAPLVELALARAAGMPIARVTGRWRGRRAQIATEGFRCRTGAEVPGTPAGSARRTRADRLAIAAAAEALADAGLGARDCRAAALVVGAVGGGMLEAEAWYWRGAREGARPAS